MSGCGSDAEIAIERLDTFADVSQPGAVRCLFRVKPPTVVFYPHSEHPVVVVQAERDPGGGARVFCDVLDRFRAAEVDCGLGFVGATWRGHRDGHLVRRTRRLRAERFGEPKLDRRERVDPASDLSQ